MGRVEGNVAPITRAARGQGRAAALRLAEEGADIIAVDVCDQIASVPYAMATAGDIEETAKQVEALDRHIVIRQADVRDGAALKSAVADGESELGPVDILVANAGIFSTEPSDTMSRQAWQGMTDTNLTDVWNALRAVLPGMKQRARGSLILTSSTAGIKGFPMLAHYTAAKHGVVGLMKAVAGKFGAFNIRATHRPPEVRGHADDPERDHVKPVPPRSREPRAGRLRRGPQVAAHPARDVGGREGHRQCGPVPGVRRSALHHGPAAQGGSWLVREVAGGRSRHSRRP
ncbi:SDR family NAD(P)-dependent oxidoreductase [Actinomycetospora aurantiaca]|uniref:SDR family NAD(P)-dependent oxidoreductase n=1 Tax=Actinomycetospora aurantiaca TaxID=3129233 RepID=UPI004038E8E2